ncbi:MAG: transglutaminase family protein [Pseudomonadota bacterium]
MTQFFDADFDVTTSVAAVPPGTRLLAATGMDMPGIAFVGCDVTGAEVDELREEQTGQTALLLTSKGAPISLRNRYRAAPKAHYPEAMFRPHNSRFSRTAEALCHEAQAIAPNAAPLDRARAIACAIAEKFSYGHVDVPFNDGHDEVPHLCSMATGSCVDINTYLVATLRAAGIEAGYATGYFFPAEKRDSTFEMHCWVVTRVNGETQDWDIAHHLKMGTRSIQPALNPKPGFRSALAHSMGLDFPQIGTEGLKLISQPVRLTETGYELVDLDIRLHHPALRAEAS